MVTVPNQTMLAGMAQRGTNETVLLDAGSYGGFSNYLNQTSTWNGAWTNKSPSLIDPVGPLPARVDMSMSYDGVNVMMFGGKGGSSTAGIYQDTWVWNGTTWSSVANAVNPPGRYGAKAAYSSGVGSVLVFGGVSTTGYLCQDQWLWNGTTKSWTQTTPVNYPPFRKGHCMAASSTKVFMFGGEDGSGTLFNDGWTYSGGNWTNIVMTNTPSVRSYAAMAYDTVNSVYVMFGGKNAYSYLDETWTFNPSTQVWTLISSNANNSAPYGKIGHQMCFDTNTNETIMFGGQGAGSNSVGNETYLFSGSTLTWIKVA